MLLPITHRFMAVFLSFALQLARYVGNSGFNDIVEANLPDPSVKPSADSDM